MSSAAVDRLSRVRLSGTPRFFSRVRARVRVEFRGGKTRWRDGHDALNILAQGGLVVLYGQQIMRSVLHNQLSGGLID